MRNARRDGLDEAIVDGFGGIIYKDIVLGHAHFSFCVERKTEGVGSSCESFRRILDSVLNYKRSLQEFCIYGLAFCRSNLVLDGIKQVVNLVPRADFTAVHGNNGVTLLQTSGFCGAFCQDTVHDRRKGERDEGRLLL